MSVCHQDVHSGRIMRVFSMRSAAPAVLVAGILLFQPQVVQAQSDAAGTQDSSAALEAKRQQMRALKWVVGPQQVDLFGNATLQVPKDYLFLGTVDTATLKALQGDLSGGRQYFLGPKDLHYEVFFRYNDDGFVRDDEKIDPDAILKSIEQGTQQANQERRKRGYDEMQVVGWQAPPHYDGQSHRLEWAVKGRNLRTNDEVVNFNTRILGRGGVMSVILVSSPESLSADIADLKTNLAGFDYQPGQRYAEYKSGDKVAKYGLAALITGGAAAIAVKTGLWKVIVGAVVAGWKVIVAAVVALFGGIAKFFKRKTA